MSKHIEIARRKLGFGDVNGANQRALKEIGARQKAGFGLESDRNDIKFRNNLPRDQFDKAFADILSGTATPQQKLYVLRHAEKFGFGSVVRRSDPEVLTVFDLAKKPLTKE